MANSGGFKRGNQLWRKAKYPGVQKKYTPEQLWAKFIEYMEDNENQYWSKEDFIKSGPGAGNKINIDVPSPPSIREFCVFAGIVENTYQKYRKCEGDFVAVCSTIDSIILTIQINGSVSGVFNASIIARLTGLVDKREVEINGILTDDERKNKIQEILKLAMKKSVDTGEDLI